MGEGEFRDEMRRFGDSPPSVLPSVASSRRVSVCGNSRRDAEVTSPPGACAGKRTISERIVTLLQVTRPPFLCLYSFASPVGCEFRSELRRLRKGGGRQGNKGRGMGEGEF